MSKRVFDLELLAQYAQLKGGKLHSTEYVNSTSYLLWECKNGHKWKASALEIMGKKSTRGVWCPKCVEAPNTLKLSLDDIEMDESED
ncbi:zinc-ribbon domain-containing protein [Halobacteriovorax sp. HLS]|uniref:zinc-ribbon domain-containing protein n=1 Tax=Halobacteriovorax sp. HLS TaxID=2234000 RepID=UPI000FDB8346|nr:zinc-ribbon domain-containing protein [Halobacteriovorax sp. HLS]